MKWFIYQLNISDRPNSLFFTALIYNNSWSYSKQTNSQAKKQVCMCLKKYYTCQTYTVDLQNHLILPWHTWSGIFLLGCSVEFTKIIFTLILKQVEVTHLSILQCCTHKEYVIGKVTDSSRHDTMLNSDFLLFFFKSVLRQPF